MADTTATASTAAPATETTTVPTASVSVTTLTTTSISLTTSPTTTITLTDTSTSTPAVQTTSAQPTTIVTTVPTSTTIVEPSTTTPSVINVTQTTTLTPTNANSSPTAPNTPSVVVVTSTQLPTSATTTATTSRTSTSSRVSSTPSALSASGSGSGSSGGLSSGGKIAIAVVIPIVAIAAAFLIGFFLWRKRKNRKNNEELRKNEMAEYGFNPNSDPTIVAGAAYTDNASEAQDDGGGYRGWGATSSNRKASTTLGSNGRAPGGPALSESSSQPGGYGSPNPASDHYSADPLMNGHPEGIDGVGALGAAAGLNRNRSGAAGIRRGPSNASSTYSEGHVSELSSDNHSVPGPYYQEEVPYNIYNDAAPSHGPYGDGSYGGTGAQPVIRDVQARRNTRIERAPTFPQNQGGISQNF